MACATLHNIGILCRDILQDTEVLTGNNALAEDFNMSDDAVGRTVRDHIRDTYFL
jgi:hypothetical protein